MAKKYDFQRVKPYPLFRALVAIARVIAAVAFRVKVYGRENLPKMTGGYILVCNHLHSIDPAFLLTTSHRMWRFIAKKELFRNPVAAWILTQANAFPIDREIIDRKALDYAATVMDDKRAGLGIFPEGQRSPDGTPQPAKGGTAMLARKTKANIIPASIYHEGKLCFRRKITVHYGEPILFEDLGLGDTPNARQTREASAKIMEAIQTLWEKGHNP
ncbi:MAG: 1-acyl-sn-glycerol-3-phosphate acyltransferase [Oscillospiraceae bacterium]|jgi:1-acyl-sn-glycerol-3-phosphate acyltransferase|nr:1-acyl-sn-glycerol-3-phosphate acyltransferase [Oscillospiraceae bacterium]